MTTNATEQVAAVPAGDVHLPFPLTEYAERRAELMAHIGADSVAIIPAAPERLRNNDIEHPYRQASDLLYLTGFPEPEAVAVLAPSREDGQYILFCRERDPDKEVWQGYRAGPEGAATHYGADQAFAMDKLDEEMPKLLQGRQTLYFELGQDSGWDRRILNWLQILRRKARAGVRAPHQIVYLGHALHEQRLRKRASELDYMQQAADIAVEAHREALCACRPGVHEYTLEAALLHTFRRHNTVPSYPPIVASGANACVLHYIDNNAALGASDLVLIDAGAELHGYASDITRTFPVAGQYSDAQRMLYDLVLEAQTAALTHCRPGEPWDAPHQAALRTLTQGLIELGILSGELDQLIEDEAYKPFYMHKTGHWLGLDVHDVGLYKHNGEWRNLEPGMCLTVEPGLYLPPGHEQVPAALQGIGIRIEDDVLITNDGHTVLSAALPKAPEALAALVGGGLA